MQHGTILNANKAVGYGIFRRFSNIDKCGPEAAGDVISGMALDYVGTDVPASFGDSWLTSGKPIRLLVQPDTFVQYLITFCSRPEADGDVISSAFVGPFVLDKCVKFHLPSRKT